jgi:NitT/TauT family transport system substrate-binding protein
MNRAAWIGAAAAAAAATGPVRAADGPVVRVGGAFGDVYAQGQYAVDFGFFHKAGLNVDFRTYTTGYAVSQAIGHGDIDIGTTTPIQIANGFEHALGFTIIAPGGENRPSDQIIQLAVRKNSPLRSPKDFEGKIVAVNARNTFSDLGLFAWMDAHGADSGKVILAEMLPTEMGPAIERGKVDAAEINEPALSLAVRDNDTRVLAQPLTAIGPRFPVSAWFTTQTYAQQNPAVCKKFLACMLEVATWANTRRRETAGILIKYGKFEPDLVRIMQRVAYAEQLRLPEFQLVLDLARKYRFIGRPIAATELVFRG